MWLCSRPGPGVAALALTCALLLLARQVPAGPAGADPQVAAGGDKEAWKKLFDGRSLTGWKESDFGEGGKVQVKDGAIVMEKGNSMCGITYAGKDFPRMDYEVTLEGKKIAGNDFFCTTTFPVGDKYCSFVVGGWGGGVIGLSSIDSEDASSNETSKSMEFKHHKWYRVRIRVSQKMIETWIDDEKVVDLDTTDRRISIRIECLPSQPFGIATWETTGAVRDIRVRALSEAEKSGPKK